MASESVAIVVLTVLWAATGLAADPPDGQYPLWDPGTPFPARADLRRPVGQPM